MRPGSFASLMGDGDPNQTAGGRGDYRALEGGEAGLPSAAAPLARSAAGIRRAQEAEAATAALGTTRDLAPARSDLLRGFQEAAQAWRAVRTVEGALANADSGRATVATPDPYPGHWVPATHLMNADGTHDTISSRLPAALPAANESELDIAAAQALHDQAMAIVANLIGTSDGQPLSGGTNADGPDASGAAEQ
jgi:hypothetical protein